MYTKFYKKYHYGNNGNNNLMVCPMIVCKLLSSNSTKELQFEH